jgi:predicted phage terminase large subunit-like protein
MSVRGTREAAVLNDEYLTRLGRQRLEPFLELVWPILEPGTPYQSNWHIGLIAEYLEAVTHGAISRLVMNVPPRYGKSLLTSVVWPVWEWISHPTRRWLFVSYSDLLAHRHGLDRRRLLQDDWFRQRYPHVWLTSDQHAKSEFHNTRRGAMVAASMAGSITGKGGDRIVIDDPHSPDQAESDGQRQHAIDRFRTTLSTRLDDKRHGAMVVVMQRLHLRDLSGVCLELGFEHLTLPALAPKRTTIIYPRSKRTVIRERDEPLWPEREGLNDLEKIRATLGTYSFAGQYLQNPIPRSGGYFRKEWWNYYDDLDLPPGTRIVQSWDLSFKDGDGSDFVVGLVAAQIGAQLYLLDRFKAKASFVDTCRAIREMVKKYPMTSAILIEDAANGPAVVDTLTKEIRGIVSVSPEGGKQARANAVQSQLEARQVFLPNPFGRGGECRPDRAWVDDLVSTCAAFPKGAFDDDVDALTQLMIYVGKTPFVMPASACREGEALLSPRFGLYHDSFAPADDATRPLYLRARRSLYGRHG